MIVPSRGFGRRQDTGTNACVQEGESPPALSWPQHMMTGPLSGTDPPRRAGRRQHPSGGDRGALPLSDSVIAFVEIIRLFKIVLAGLGEGFVSPECLFFRICVRRILKSSKNLHLSMR